ncbi:hypothetical protein M413DRAFT_25287 [Hebeloma cylindrosporum]|uniref:Uncharacterized protein n=1 Tax=Hebeloma cylindrosporum TaxID=76867 RepID=A0A0C3CL72_HEBCY|nr:hypothetical protein M413DRAFT_25287 [Hebeloma cylindrosporum h7]
MSSMMKTSAAIALLAAFPLVIYPNYLYWAGYLVDVRLLGTKKKESTSSPRKYSPPNFNDCAQLQIILQDVKDHILRSSSTRSIYAIICQLFHRHMDNPQDIDQDINKTFDDNVNTIFTSFWPTFAPLPERLMDGHLGVVWSETEEKTTGVFELRLNPDLIVALEKTTEGSDLSILLSTLLIATIFHELCHYVTKSIFHSKMTPLACGPELPGSLDGESGVLFEEMLIGATISAVRKDSEYAENDMDKIKGLAFLASIKTNHLQPMPLQSLQPYVDKKGFTRFRSFQGGDHRNSTDGPELPPGRSTFPNQRSGLRIVTDKGYILS